jgi:hypothetical protein
MAATWLLLMIVGFVFLLVLGVIVLSVVSVANKNGSVLIWIAVPMLILLTLAPLLLWTWVVRPRHQNMVAQEKDSSAVLNSNFHGDRSQKPLVAAESRNLQRHNNGSRLIGSSVDVAGKNWDDLTGIASIYPSVADCGKPFAKLILSDLPSKSDSPDEEYLFRIELAKYSSRETNNTNLNDLIDQLKIEIESRLDEGVEFDVVRNVSKDSQTHIEDSGKTVVLVRLASTVESETTMSNYSMTQFTGSIRCRWAVGDATEKTRSLAFVTKSWLGTTAKFISKHPQYKWMIGISQRIASSPEEASKEAFKDVNAQLQLRNKYFANHSAMEQNVVDRFVQKVSLSYGEVWREAVLIRVDAANNLSTGKFSGGWVASEASAATGGYRNPSNTVAAVPLRSRSLPISPESGLALLAGFVILIGWVCNLLTQGYYRVEISSVWVLLVGIIVCMLVGFVMVS